MLDEEAKKRLIKAIFILREEGEEISDEDLQLAQELIETHPKLTDLDRKILKLRIYRGLKFREIAKLLDLKYMQYATNRFQSAARKIRIVMYMTKRLNGDETKKLSKLIKTRSILLALRRAGIETIGSLSDHLRLNGSLRNAELDKARAASTIYYLDRDGYDLRKLITDEELLKEFEELDRRNYVHIDQFESLLKDRTRVKSVERVTNSYTSSSKTEFGSFDVKLNDSTTLRLKMSVKPISGRYELTAEIEEAESFEGFDYTKKVSKSVSTDSENLISALDFILFISGKSAN